MQKRNKNVIEDKVEVVLQKIRNRMKLKNWSKERRF